MSVTFIYADCKLMGLIGMNNYKLSHSVTPNSWNSFTSPCLMKLRSLGGSSSSYPNNNPHGWALISYNENSQTVSSQWRNAESSGNSFNSAYNSAAYLSAMSQMLNQQPRIVLGHVRNATNAATQHMPDPHPFIMNFEGKDFSFIHNGAVNVSTLTTLVGQEYLDEHPLHPYNGNIIDSELYFYWIMKNIEEQNGDIQRGIKNALRSLTNNTSHSALNFVLSDGIDLYAYRYKTDGAPLHKLAYFYDIEAERNNHYYCGVMSIFPDQYPDWTDGIDTPDNVQAHLIENDELVYISATGNIVRLPNFGSSYIAMDNYRQKRDFHKGYNWKGFPILPIDAQTQTVAVSPLFDFYLAPGNGGLNIIEADDVTLYYTASGWNVLDYQVHMNKLYKMNFESNSPSIHTTYGNTATSITIPNARLYPQDALIIDDIIGYQKYWVSYTLLPSQNIKDAFGDSWENVFSVYAEDWYYRVMPQDPTKEDPSQPVPLYSWTTTGKNMEFGKGYIVTFKNNQDYFAWNRPYLIEIPEPVRQKPEFFEWEDAPEYLVLDIVQAEDQPEILEVGAYQGEDCIGAVKPDKLPCQLLIYPKYDNPNPVTFMIVYNEKGQPKAISNYKVYNKIINDYIVDVIMPQKGEEYIVKLTNDTPSQYASSINPLISINNYPNPFNPSTKINFSLKHTADVNISIYNTKGQKVKDFGVQNRTSGTHSLQWDGKDNNNHSIAGGIYFIRISSDKYMLTSKMVMLK